MTPNITKITLSFIAIFFFVASLNAQSQTISKDEYEKVFSFAVSATNADYPHIFKVITTEFENGKIVWTETEVRENESPGHSREIRTILADRKETIRYQLTVGFGNVFCSEDGVNWSPPTKYECKRSMILYGPRDAESTEYSVAEKSIDGKKVKVYREYSVFATLDENVKKDFQEKLSTIDSRGYFITVVGTEGTLDPLIVQLKREQSWIINAEIKPIVSPIK